MGAGDPTTRFTAPFEDGIFSAHGRLAQRESAAFTRQRSLVRNQHRPLSILAFLLAEPYRMRRVPCTSRALVRQRNCYTTVDLLPGAYPQYSYQRSVAPSDRSDV